MFVTLLLLSASILLPLFVSAVGGDNDTHQCHILEFVLLSLSSFINWLRFRPDNPNAFPRVQLNPSTPGLPRGYYRKHRRVRNYHLYQRVLRRSHPTPIRDPPRHWWDPRSWRFKRRTPWTNNSSGGSVTRQPTLKTPPKHKNRRRKPPKERWCRLTPEEAEADRAADFDRIKHRFLHQSWMMYDMQFGVSLDDLLDQVDPTKSFRLATILQREEFVAFRSHDTNPKPNCFSTTNFLATTNLAGVARINQAITTMNATPDDVPIVIDSGASASITPILADFVGDLERAPDTNLVGLNNKIRIAGVGTVEWSITDYFGVTRLIRTKAFYVPDATIRLFSPQAFFQENDGQGKCIIEGRKTTLGLPDGSVLEFPYNCGSNLPLMLLSPDAKVAGAHYSDAAFLSNPFQLQAHLSVTSPLNQNLTPSQKELLLIHQKLGHSHFQWCQRLVARPRNGSNPILSTKTQGVSTCDAPVCTACQLAKQARRTPGHSRTGHSPDSVLRAGDLKPGDCVSVDQYISGLPGRLPHTYGKEKKKDRYKGGTIFVDHASGFIFHRNQVTLTDDSNIKSKKLFDQVAADYGVTLKKFLADNVPFGNDAFTRALDAVGQTIQFSGVGAHHQNGVAERAIATVTRWARAMLLHSVIMWPDQADLSLWPFAFDHAVYLWNNLPNRETKLAPVELFSGTRFSTYNHLQRAHVWGCPVYVLDPKLQDGKKIPKWNPRARRGQFLGYSPLHSTTIGRILNPRTGAVSAQYHVVYDDHFSSVPNAEAGGLFGNIPFNADDWARLVASGHERVLDPDFDAAGNQLPIPPLHPDWNPPPPNAPHPPHPQPIRHPLRRSSSPVAASEGEMEDTEPVPFDDDTTSEGDNATEGADPNNEPDVTEDDQVNDDVDKVIEEQEDEQEAEPVYSRRSRRRIKPPKRLIQEMPTYFPHEQDQFYNPKRKVAGSRLNQQFLMSLQWNQMIESLRSSDLRAMLSSSEYDYEENTVEWMHPLTLSARANAEDNPTWEEAMSGPDRAGYWEAACKEIDTLTKKRDAWDVVARQPWMNVLPSTWAFKCKRYPDGSIRKLKARFCARGDRQIEDVDYFDTFAPVVKWNTVRLLLTLSSILGLSTRQVDYVSAFVQAPIDRDPNWDSMSEEERERSGVFVQMPRGFSEPGKVLRLKRSLYGLKQSPRNFFQHLKSKLEGAGFTSEVDVDPCLFISDKVICLVYVDDTLFFSPKPEYIDEVVTKLSDSDLELEEEDSVAGFLGVHIERNDCDGTITLTQTGLIKRIIDALNISHLPKKETPALADPLVKDDGGEPPNGTYSYPSVVGMLQYLHGHSRPDITFAVSQVARFTHSPKRSHEIALERIGQYLKGTIDDGLILKPTGAFDIDAYVDADFAGLWPLEDKQDPSCVKSRTGFVICISSCPVIWTSKLQSEIALSTMESEYNALSLCMKSVLPFKNTVKAVARGVGLASDMVTTFKTTVWEDNAGALALANMEPGQITPRSKHYAIKYHWFRSHLKPNEIEIKKIGTDAQKADILTKGLRSIKFKAIRKLLCGW